MDKQLVLDCLVKAIEHIRKVNKLEEEKQNLLEQHLTANTIGLLNHIKRYLEFEGD